MPRGVKGSGKKPGHKSIENKTMYFIKGGYDDGFFENEDDLVEYLEDQGWDLHSNTVIYKVTACKKMKFKRPALAGMLVEA